MPRPDRSHERIPAILAAAAKIFARDGVQGAKLDDVAAEAGLSKAAIYLYFKNKDALVFALLEQFFDANLSALKMIPDGGSTADRLCDWLAIVGSAMEGGAHFQSVGFEFLALAGRDEKARQMVLGFYEQYVATISDMLSDDGISNPSGKASEIVALLEGLNLLWMAHKGDIEFVKTAQSGVRALLD